MWNVDLCIFSNTRRVACIHITGAQRVCGGRLHEWKIKWMDLGNWKTENKTGARSTATLPVLISRELCRHKTNSEHVHSSLWCWAWVGLGNAWLKGMAPTSVAPFLLYWNAKCKDGSVVGYSPLHFFPFLAFYLSLNSVFLFDLWSFSRAS